MWCTRTNRANPNSRVYATSLFTHLKLAYLPLSLCCFNGKSYSFSYRPQLILWDNQLPNKHNPHSLLTSTHLTAVFVEAHAICLRRASQAVWITELGSLLFIMLPTFMSSANFTCNNSVFSPKWLVKVV